MNIHIVLNEQDMQRCFPVMRQLRPHLKQDEFVPLVKELNKTGYRLVMLEGEGEIKAVAGFRISTMLSRGKFMYVDDLVTDADERSKGYGSRLFDWLVDYAKKDGCRQLDLDSGVQRGASHRFYFSKGMYIPSFHFSLTFDDIE